MKRKPVDPVVPQDTVINLYSKEELALDNDLVRQDTAAAGEELQRRIEWRQRNKMRLQGLMDPHALQFAPEATLEMLSDLGIRIADDEIERRRLAGEKVAA